MHRFFKEVINDPVIIEGDDFKHIIRVLRLGIGDEIEVCDGKSRDYRVQIENISKEFLSAKVIENYPCTGEDENFKITLFQSLPKGSKMDIIIQKAVELGVFEINPFSSIRSIVELAKKEEKKRERWQRIAYEAAKQSRRGIIPQVEPIIDICQMKKVLGEFDLILLAYEKEKKETLKQALLLFEKRCPDLQEIKIALIVGPEGGFSDNEVKSLIQAGAHPISLGDRILRTETAGFMMISQLNFWKE